MIIGIYLENYRAGGLDSVLVNLVDGWPDSQDRFVIFCNQSHAGLENLKKRIRRQIFWEIYPSPAPLRLYYSSAPQWLKRPVYLAYVIAVCYGMMPFEAFFLWRRFRRCRLNAILVHNGGWPAARSARSAILAACWAGLRHPALAIHAVVRPHHPGIRLQERCVERLLKFLGVRMAAVSRAVQESMACHTLLPKALVIHNGISEAADSGAPFSEDGLRKEMGLDADAFLIGMFGTYEFYRGHDFMLEVMARVVKFLPRAMLLVGGAGTLIERKRIERLMEKLSLQRQVRLLGFRSDVASIMRSLNVVVNPAQAGEGFGLVCLEAMAMSKPVAATRTGGIPEVVEDGKTGFLVPVGEVDAFVQRILELARDPELGRRMGEAGYLRYKNYFTRERMAGDYYRLCHDS